MVFLEGYRRNKRKLKEKEGYLIEEDKEEMPDCIECKQSQRSISCYKCDEQWVYGLIWADMGTECMDEEEN